MNGVNSKKRTIIESNVKEKHKNLIYSLPEKKFEIRESPLIILSENSNFRVLKNIFLSLLLCLIMTASVYEYHHNGSISFGLPLIAYGFQKIHLSASLWIVQNLFAICCYYCFVWWANIRLRLSPKSKYLKIWDTSFITISISYYLIQLVGTSMTVNYLHMTHASAMITCAEQVRLLMKTHAFLRTNYKKVQNFKTHSDQHLEIAPLQHFAYFLLAPTMIYRDEYPRTKSIRWKFIINCLFEFTTIIFFYALLSEMYLIPSVKDIGTEPVSFLYIFLIMCNNILIGILCMLSTFYIVIHTTQNFFAELLRFGDREFYRDWWNSKEYGIYFRKWNILVSDWLYTYIYKEFYENITPGHKPIGKMIVFLLSAVMHEWVLAHTCGFLFPALFISFCYTFVILVLCEYPYFRDLENYIVSLFHREVPNIFLWYRLMFGAGWLLTLYMMEYYARLNMPANENVENYRYRVRLFDIIK